MRFSVPDHHLTVAEGLARLPGPKGERFVELFGHGTLSVELYAPRGQDPQSPHTRDEVYVADEAFFTGTAAEVTPIRELDNRSIGSGRRGPITERLQGLFFEYASGRRPGRPDWLVHVNWNKDGERHVGSAAR